MASELSDRDLIERVKARDDNALTLMYDRYAGVAFALAYRTLGDRGQAEDVVQDAFLSLWRRAETFDSERGQMKRCGARCASCAAPSALWPLRWSRWSPRQDCASVSRRTGSR